jgi:hypothetical protein
VTAIFPFSGIETRKSVPEDNLSHKPPLSEIDATRNLFFSRKEAKAFVLLAEMSGLELGEADPGNLTINPF